MGPFSCQGSTSPRWSAARRCPHEPRRTAQLGGYLGCPLRSSVPRRLTNSPDYAILSALTWTWSGAGHRSFYAVTSRFIEVVHRSRAGPGPPIQRTSPNLMLQGPRRSARALFYSRSHAEPGLDLDSCLAYYRPQSLAGFDGVGVPYSWSGPTTGALRGRSEEPCRPRHSGRKNGVGRDRTRVWRSIVGVRRDDNDSGRGRAGLRRLACTSQHRVADLAAAIEIPALIGDESCRKMLRKRVRPLNRNARGIVITVGTYWQAQSPSRAPRRWPRGIQPARVGIWGGVGV